MHPTVDLYFFEIPLYTMLVALGAVSGLVTAYLSFPLRSPRKWSLFLDGAFVVFIAGWIGARAYHVALNWNYYAARPEEIAQIGSGGFGMRGALIAGFVGLALYAWARRRSFWRLADAAALGLAVGQAIGWAGALAEGANYGVASDSQIALDLPDLYGVVAPRFPLQQAEIVLFVSLFVGLLVLAARQPRAGTLFLTYLFVASAANFALGFQRGDETTFIGALRVDQVVDAALVGWALLAGLFRAASPRGGNVGYSGNA